MAPCRVAVVGAAFGLLLATGYLFLRWLYARPPERSASAVDSETGYEIRQDQANGLPSDLKKRIGVRAGFGMGIPNGRFAVLFDRRKTPTERNDAANRLLRERDARLAGELIRMLNDETENLTWRNYCVQFLRSCYEQDQQPEVLKALEDTCRHKLPELSSCALWGLAQLAVPRPWMATLTAGDRGSGIGDRVTTPGGEEVKAGEAGRRPAQTVPNGRAATKHAEAPFENPLDRPLLPAESEAKARALALAWLRDDKGHLLARTAGAQSCSRMGVKDAAPKLRELAAAASEPISLRVVCIAGLAQLGDQESRPLLEGLASDKSQRVRQAADMALKKLGARSHRGGAEHAE